MSHLTDLELIAAIEDAGERDLPPARSRHLDACETCRARADDMRGVIVEARDATVPEPSPLFWQHFSARVRERIDGNEPESAHEGRLAAWLAQASVRWGAFAALIVALMVAGVWQVNAPSKRVPRSAPPMVQSSANPVERPDQDADPAWAVVRTVADSVDWSDAVVAGLDAEPNAVESVARTLSPEERSELVKLLLAEAKRKGA